MKALALALVLLLAGCASPEQYTQYLVAQQAIETAKYHADSERYRAMATIAQHGTDTARVAAVMALTNRDSATNVAVLKPPTNEALQWASILVPSLTNIAGFAYGAQVSMNASNNAAAVAQSTNQTFLGMGQAIQSPAVPQANVTTTTTIQTQDRHDVLLSGTGVLGSGSYSVPTDNSVYAPFTDNSVYTPFTDNSVVSPAPAINPL